MSMTIPSINASPASREYPTPPKVSPAPLAPFTRSENTEIHQNKMLAAALASIPVIGFFKPIWAALFITLKRQPPVVQMF